MRKVLTRSRFSYRAGPKPLKKEAGLEKKNRETRNSAQLREPAGSAINCANPRLRAIAETRGYPQPAGLYQNRPGKGAASAITRRRGQSLIKN